MTKIFLSYARSDDESFVRRLYEDLTAAGFDVWFDRVSMPSRNLTFHQEIQKAVAGCDRLVLVVGPGAASSEYVRQEWQYAWFEAEKVVVPILRHGDYPLAIDELKLLHCEDFRDPTDASGEVVESNYQTHLKELVRILNDPAQPMGKLIGVPGLPAHYLSRTDRLVPLREAVRSGLDSAAPLGGMAARQQFHGIGGTSKHVGMHGMGGIGKSVLANLLAHDRLVRQAFPDGIVWVGLGSEPDVAELMRRVDRDFDGDGAFATEHEGKTRLKDVLADRAVLLVLDDAWRRRDVEAFDVLGPRCRALVTTRDAGLLTSMGGTHHLVELLTDDEALRLLALAVGKELEELPGEARAVVKQCGRLPLAVALAGGMVATGMSWTNLLTAFDRHKLEYFEDEHRPEQHQSLWRMIEISVQALSAEEQIRLVELGVFPEDQAVPEQAVASLWQHTGQLDELDTPKLLLKLKQRSLVQLSGTANATSNDGIGGVSLHDLIHDFCIRFAQKQLGGERELHTRLLDAYRQHCPDGWHKATSDGYLHGHLRDHLLAVDGTDELVGLLTDLRWIQAKSEAGLVFDLVSDYGALRAVLPEFQKERTREAERVKSLRVYGDRLVGYAKGEGPLPTPPDTRPTQESMRRAEAASSAAESANAVAWRASHLRMFSNFVSSYSHQLDRFPDQTIPIAFNHASGGSVTAHAEELAGSLQNPSLRRDPRPPAPPEKPLCLRTLERHTSSVSALALTPDGNRAVSGSRDNTLRVWDLASGECLRTLKGHTNDVSAVALTPDGNTALSGSRDNTLRVWDLASGECLRTLEGHFGWVSALALTPDGNRAVSGSWDNTLRVWDLASGECLRTLKGHTNDVSAVALTPDGNTALSGSSDEALRVWDLASGECLRTLEGHTSLVTAVSLTPDGNTAVSGSWDSTLRVWDVASGKCLRTGMTV